MLKNKQPMPVNIRASMQQQQQLASARNRRLAQQMENRPSVQAALKLKQVREWVLMLQKQLVISVRQSLEAVVTWWIITRWLRAKAELLWRKEKFREFPFGQVPISNFLLSFSFREFILSYNFVRVHWILAVLTFCTCGKGISFDILK